MLERYLTSGREAWNNRRTMNREKSWEIFFPLYLFVPATWCHLGIFLVTNTKEKEKKRKEKKKRNGYSGTKNEDV